MLNLFKIKFFNFFQFIFNKIILILWIELIIWLVDSNVL